MERNTMDNESAVTAENNKTRQSRKTTSEDIFSLSASAKETLTTLRRATESTLTGEEGMNLEDDEPALQTSLTRSPHEKSVKGSIKKSSMVPMMISDDIRKAYDAAKLKDIKEDSEEEIPQNTKTKYEKEQTSLQETALKTAPPSSQSEEGSIRKNSKAPMMMLDDIQRAYDNAQVEDVKEDPEKDIPTNSKMKYDKEQDSPHEPTPETPPLLSSTEESVKGSGGKSNEVLAIIADDIQKACTQLEDSEKDAPQKPKRKYSEEQTSLIGAVLGLGERNKNDDDNFHKTMPKLSEEEQESAETTHARTGTMAGLGDITDEEADGQENTDENVSIHDYRTQQSTSQEENSTSLPGEEKKVGVGSVEKVAASNSGKKEETGGSETQSKSSRGVMRKLYKFFCRNK